MVQIRKEIFELFQTSASSECLEEKFTELDKIDERIREIALEQEKMKYALLFFADKPLLKDIGIFTGYPDFAIHLSNVRTGKSIVLSNLPFQVPYQQYAPSFSVIKARDMIFAIGGIQYSLSSHKNTCISFEQYLPKPTPIKEMIRPRFKPALVEQIGKYIYALCGFTTDDEFPVQHFFCERYDIDKDSWAAIPPLNEAKNCPAACMFDSRFIYVYALHHDYKLERYDTLDGDKGWTAMKIKTIFKSPSIIECSPFICQISPTTALGAYDTHGYVMLEFGMGENVDETYLERNGQAKGEKCDHVMKKGAILCYITNSGCCLFDDVRRYCNALKCATLQLQGLF
eukprot:TRINITY_DN917_c0_g1_i1.p1 TRINITY_DN917_c0_g1~~TRINITY_DN917_c0_g1_i1.p1  ORF type:complete len:343 (-),score=20.32 TRINITY_DN917_c0_g1_i1:48-1076(-)